MHRLNLSDAAFTNATPSTSRSQPRTATSLGSTLVLASILLSGAPAWSSECRTPRVHVQSGWLEGTRAGDGLDRFLGVPYAAPPVGPLRWRPPEPPASWNGVRSAQDLPPRCAQIGGEGPGSEDCLYVNVFVPEGRHRRPLPVLFFVHGGSLRVGSAWDNDPSRIARETNSIVVMVNYRLGMLGFLNHPSLDSEAEDGVSGNYGLMDQQRALHWVHDQIGAFGGDPDNITISGMSAGAWSVCAHLTSENVAGTFSRAALQSGDCFTRDADSARGVGVGFAQALGCSDEQEAAECIRGKTTDEVLATDSWAFEAAIVSGGALLPEPPAERVAAGEFHPVPLLLGFTENELRAGAAGLFPLTLNDYSNLMLEFFGDQSDAVQSLYPLESYSDPFYSLIDAADDSGMFGSGCQLYRLADQFAARTPTYVYRFDDASAPNPTWIDAQEGFVAGASHGSDEPYWFDRPFDTLPALTESQSELASQMIEHLGSFMRDGTPGGRHTPRWPRYDARRQRIMRFVPQASEVTRTLPAEDNCATWTALGF